MKKRYYVKCVRDYLHLFKGCEDNILNQNCIGGLKEPYIYNSSFIEGDPFMRNQEQLEEEQKQQPNGAMTQDQMLTIEGMKIQLKTLYAEIIQDYELLRPRLTKIIAEDSQIHQ